MLVYQQQQQQQKVPRFNKECTSLHQFAPVARQTCATFLDITKRYTLKITIVKTYN